MFCAAMASFGDGFGFVGAFASAVSSLIPTRRSWAGRFASSVGPTLAREAWLLKQAAESPSRRLLERQKPESNSKSRLGWFILASRSAQRGPFTFISRRKIDTRPLRPVTSKKLRKSTRRRLRTASNWAAALGCARLLPAGPYHGFCDATRSPRAANRLHAHKNGRSLVWKDCSASRTARRGSAPS